MDTAFPLCGMTHDSRVGATLGHVLWGSGQCQVPREQEGMQGEVRGLRPLERCGEPGLFRGLQFLF